MITVDSLSKTIHGYDQLLNSSIHRYESCNDKTAQSKPVVLLSELRFLATGDAQQLIP